VPTAVQQRHNGSSSAASETESGAFDTSSESEAEAEQDTTAVEETHGILSASEALKRGFVVDDDDDVVNMTPDQFMDSAPAEDSHTNVVNGSGVQWTRVMKRQFKDYKRAYYRNKMDYKNITKWVDEL
jgi:hypothetical protein